MKEAEFLAGVFFEFELPYDKIFLFKYFMSDLEKQFLRYYFCFQEIEHFSNHTGFCCQTRWTRILEKRLKMLMQCHEYYKKNFELEKLAKIEMGKMKFGEIKKYALEYSR
jgi:hypothetical protein